MQIRLYIFILLCLRSADYLAAQAWTKEDSVWLQNILSGKDTLRLNPETMRAIQSGTLINNTHEPASEMQLAPNQTLPILKDFSEYIRSDSTTRRKVALKDLPPGVFWLYGPPPLPKTTVYQNMLDAWKRSPFYRASSGGLVSFDAGELTSRKAWIHKRNAKRDGTWKNYNNLPTPDIIKKKKQYARQYPELAGQDTLLLRKDSVGKQPDSLRLSLTATQDTISGSSFENTR